MAKRMGTDTLVWVQSAVANTYNYIKGQNSGLKFGTGRKSVDVSDKNRVHDLEAPGSPSIQISVDVTPDFPDTNGFERVQSLYNSGTAEKIQIRKGGIAGNGTTDVLFEGSVYFLGIDRSADRNDTSKVTIKIGLADDPITNALA